MEYPTFDYELKLLDRGYTIIAGLDEVGRGAWAGPVVAACVTFPLKIITQLQNNSDENGSQLVPSNQPIFSIRDSKTLSKKQRDVLATFIKEKTQWAIGESSNEEIDRLGIGQATRLAMSRSLLELSIEPDHLLIDGREYIGSPIKQQSIIKGDSLSFSIAAASIIAKVYRDQLMEQYEILYPHYGFRTHVGYGTKHHSAALEQFGPCPIHRQSYKPIQRFS